MFVQHPNDIRHLVNDRHKSPGPFNALYRTKINRAEHTFGAEHIMPKYNGAEISRKTVILTEN